MLSRHQRLLALSLPITLIAALGLAVLTAQPVVEGTAARETAVQFAGKRAQAEAAAFAAQFPQRVVGSPGGEAARAWIADRLNVLGLETETLPFTVVALQERGGVQLWATVPGASDQTILLTTHYDTPEHGGRDNAGGVAVLLELARVFAQERPRHTLILMASDAHEYGQAWGMKTFVEQSSLRGNLVAAVALEADETQSAVRLNAAGFHFGYAPLWLRQLPPQTVALAVGADEFAARALPFGMTEHGMLLRAGVPAIGLSGPVEALGAAAEQTVRRLDALESVPSGSTLDWQVTESTWLPGSMVLLLSLLVFAPLFIATGLALHHQRPHWQMFQPEGFGLLGALVPLLNGYAALYILVRLGLLPQYEWFPASPGDPFLVQPTDWAALVALGVAGFSAWEIFIRPRGWGQLAGRLVIPTRRVTLLIVLAVLMLGTWLLNPLAAVFLLLPAAYLWPWIEPRHGRAGMALNGMLALGGLLPVAGLAVGLAFTPGLGLWWWFMMAGAAYGVYPLPAVLIVLLVLALWLRFTWLGMLVPLPMREGNGARAIR